MSHFKFLIFYWIFATVSNKFIKQDFNINKILQIHVYFLRQKCPFSNVSISIENICNWWLSLNTRIHSLDIAWFDVIFVEFSDSGMDQWTYLITVWRVSACHSIWAPSRGTRTPSHRCPSIAPQINTLGPTHYSSGRCSHSTPWQIVRLFVTTYRTRWC